MNSNLQPKVDAHQISLDLGGLEDLLAPVNPVAPAAPVETEAAVAAETEDETATIMRLLDKLSGVSELLNDTRERLTAANERMNSMTSMIQLQSRQLELLGHYQAQAAKCAGLEHKLVVFKQEIIRLRQPLYKKLYALLVRFYNFMTR